MSICQLQNMDYIRPKLQINRYKKQPPHILFRKIAQEIQHETQTKLNFSLDYDLSLWLIRLMSLDPKYRIGNNRLFDRVAVDALIKDYLQIVSDADSIFVQIVKMKVYYINHYIDKKQIIEKHAGLVARKMEPLTRLIINTRLKSKKECDEYAKKLAVDIVAHYSLGNPEENDQVVQETINALKSMMSTNDVMAFSMLDDKVKIESLSGIREIVCGMRAFNKDAGHCGEGLIDIEKTVRNGYKATKLQLSSSVNEITSHIKSLMRPLAKVLTSIEMREGPIENNNVIKSITLYRQCERYLHDLLNTLADHQMNIERCLKNYRSQLNKIHETVKFRTAIPITSIFPKFIELAKLWEQLQHQTYILSEINTVNGQLMFLTQNHSSYIDIGKNPQAGLDVSPNYGVNDSTNSDKNINDVNQKVEKHTILNVSKNEHIKIVPYEVHLKIEYDAFCAWKLLKTSLFFPSDLTIGLIYYKNQYYAFSDVNVADLFMENPDLYVNETIAVICRNPELALFFDMYNLLEQNEIQLIQMNYKYDLSPAHSKDSCSIEIQTDIHPIPCNKDKNYVWNIWDLGRMAIKLANIQKCETHSTQTYLKSSCGTQTNL